MKKAFNSRGSLHIYYTTELIIVKKGTCSFFHDRGQATTTYDMKSFVLVLAWFVVIFGINTTSDISKLLYVISNLRQFWNITSGIYAKYHVQIMLLFVYTTTCKSFVIFTCRYFKLSWNTTSLSPSNSSNFSCSSVRRLIYRFPGFTSV